MAGTLGRAAALAACVAGGLALVAYAFLSAGAIAQADLAPSERALNVALLAVEVAISVFMLSLLALAVPDPALPEPPPLRTRPRVALLVPTFREDAPVLRDTLAGVARLDWPRDRLVVAVVDDTPPGPAAAAIEAAAREGGASYVRRAARRGYKAGALNDALRGIDAEVVAVLDVDHVPEPDWLERAVALLLADPRAGFVQGRLDWRNKSDWKGKMQAIFQIQFFEALQRSKAARGTVVFAGSGAVFRREALDAIGGFPEDTLVEDFAVTVETRLAGWKGLYLPRVVARGLLPWTLSDVARQFWRWTQGITRVYAKRARRIARSDAPLAVRIECTLDGLAYSGTAFFVAAGALLVVAALTATPLPRAPALLVLLAPAVSLVSDVGLAAVGMVRARERGYRWLLPYHLMTLAYMPVCFAGAVAGLLGFGDSVEGRVAKEAGRAHARRGMAGVAAIGAAAGIGLVIAGGALWSGGSHAGAWAVELGVAFGAPALLSGATERADLSQRAS